MDDAFGGVEILRQLHLTNGVDAERVDRRRYAIQRVTCRRQQLLCLTRIAHVVRALAKKADPLSTHVEPRPHAIAIFARRPDGDRGRERQAADSTEGIRDDQTLDLELAFVRDMSVERAAA